MKDARQGFRRAYQAMQGWLIGQGYVDTRLGNALARRDQSQANQAGVPTVMGPTASAAATNVAPSTRALVCPIPVSFFIELLGLLGLRAPIVAPSSNFPIIAYIDPDPLSWRRS